MATIIEKIKSWLDTPAEQRDLEAGAMLLLQVNKNQILFANIMRNPKVKADTLAYQLQKVYNTRIIETTKEEVKNMMEQVNGISVKCGLDATSKRSEWQQGKRTDHDSLPQEVKQLWEDNLKIRRRMSECHMRMRLVSEQNSSCPDNDRYPFAKEIIALDKTYRSNFGLYDNYVQGTSLNKTVVSEDKRTEQKNIVKTINLAKGRYAKSKDSATADRIKNLYNKLLAPSEKLTAELTNLGIL